jgi:MFS family permease
MLIESCAQAIGGPVFGLAERAGGELVFRQSPRARGSGMLLRVQQPDRGVFSAEYRGLSIGVLVLMTSIAVEGIAIATILPTVAADLNGLEWYGWAFSAFMLASLVGAIGGGELTDRRSPALAGQVALALFAAGLLVAGSAPTWPMLLLGRMLQGLGAGSMGTLAYLAVARGYPEPLRPRLLALLATAWVLPALLGPAVAGVVAEHVTWRLVFLGILAPVAAGAVFLVPALRGLPVAPSEGAGTQRLLKALQLAAGVGIVLWAAGTTSILVAVALGLVGVGLSVPALRALLPAGTFGGRPGLPAAVGVRGLLAFGFFGCEALIPLGLANERGLSASLVGLSLSAGALTWVAGSWLQERAEQRGHRARGVRVRIGLGLVLVAIAGVAVVILTPSLPVWPCVLAWALAGLGMGLAYPGSTLVAMDDPNGQRGLGAASLLVAETVGIAAGAGAGGALVALTVHLDLSLAYGLAWGFAVSATGVLLAFAPALRLMPTRRAAASEHSAGSDVLAVGRAERAGRAAGGS